MAGHTDSITLVSPAPWWPSFGALSDHPLDPTRSFSAAVTTAEAALGAEALPLSKLGRATFLGARWVEQTSSVAVVNVFSGETIVLSLRRGGPASAGRKTESLSLYDLAMNGQIRIAPARPEDVAAPKNPKSVVRECLLQPHTTAMWNSTREDLCRGCRFSSVLLWSTEGDGEEQLLLDYAVEQFPTFFVVNGRRHLVEFRSVDFSRLLALSACEAAAVIRCALQPPPAARDESLRHVVCVTLRHAGLLGGATNVHTTVVCSELCHGLDAFCAQKTQGTVMLVWSTAADPKQIPISLRARLSGRQVCIARPSAEECASVLRSLLGPSALRQEERAVEAAAVGMSSLSLKEIMRLAPARAEKLCEAPGEQPKVDALTPYRQLFGVDKAIDQLESLLVWPLSNLRSLQALRVPCTKGALLYGPTGCGKTAIMSALAQRLRRQGDGAGPLHIMLVDGLSLIDKEVGRTEKNIVEKFEEARSRSPTVLFLDNLDALAAPRGRTTTETNVVGDRSLSTLLTEMDGVSSDPQRVVVVVASAPSPAALDPAACRPGRLDVHIALSNVDGACAAAHLKSQLKQFVRRILTKRNSSTSSFCAPADDVMVLSCEKVVNEGVSALVARRPSMSAATVAAICREIMIAVLSSAFYSGDGRAEEGSLPGITDEQLSVILNDVFASIA